MAAQQDAQAHGPDLDSLRPSVRTPPAIATWRTSQRWGPNLGDITDYLITRVDGGRLTVKAGRSGEVEIPAGSIPWFTAAVAAAAEWTAAGGEP